MPTVTDDHTMKTRDELDEEYREGWRLGDKERRESDKRGLVEGLAHEAADMGLMIGTMGLSHLHELGRSDAFKAGHLAGRRGEPCDPDSFIEEMEEKEAERKEAERERQRQEEKPPPPSSDPPSSQSDSTEQLVGCVLWLAGIMIALWLAFMALAITVMLLPLWLGGVAAGVITGFILANKIAGNLSEELLTRVSIWVEEKKKIRRYRISQEFFKGAIKLNPHMLVLIGVTSAYGVALALWPFLSTGEIFNRVLLAVGVVAGTILGTVAGRRILSGQLENRVFERAQSDAPTRLHGPKVALGFAVPGVLLLAGFWVAALLETRGNVNFAKSFGMESEKPARQRIAESPIERVTQPSPAKSTMAASQRTTPIQTDDLNPLLFDNYKAFVNSKRSEFVVQFDWMVRFGAIQWIAPISGLAFDQAAVGETVAGGAFRGSTVVSIPIRSGFKATKRTWAPDMNIDAPWDSSTPPQSEEQIADKIQLNAKGPGEAATLVSILRQMSQQSPTSDRIRPSQPAERSSRAELTAEILDTRAPGADDFSDRSLVLRRNNVEVARYPTYGYVIGTHISPNQRVLAINNRRGNSGDYLWLIASNGKALKQPEDDLGVQIERRASELADQAAKRKSSLYEPHKTWINAVRWDDDTTLVVNVRTQHLIPNRDGLKQDVIVRLRVGEDAASIENVVLGDENDLGSHAVEAFIRARLNTEQSHDLDRILENYAESVSYWNNGVVDRNFIHKDKADYFSRWPVTSEEIITPIEISADAAGWKARFKTKFRVENATTGTVIGGVQESEYTLRVAGNGFKIVAENGKVIEKNKTVAAPESQVTAMAEFVGERFPETRMRQLAVPDVSRMSLDQLRYAINEMFARHGADFPKEDIKRQFQRFGWYRPRSGLEFDQIEAGFSEIEKANLKLLGAARDAKATGKPISSLLPASPTAESAAGECKRPTPRSQVVTFPGLRALVNRQLDDSWLYGDLMLLSWDSPRATFVSWAQFAGAGGTLVEVEFAGGCGISGKSKGRLPNPGAPGTPLFSPTRMNPIRLVVVNRDRSGRIVVQARSAEGFSQ